MKVKFMMKKRLLGLLLGLLLSTSTLALDPSTITLAWDYNLSANTGVTGFQLFTLKNDGTHAALVADVPLPTTLPTPNTFGFAVFSADVIPDRTGRRKFVAIAVTDDLAVFSVDSNIAIRIVKPDNPRNTR